MSAAGDPARFAAAWIADDGRLGHLRQAQALADQVAEFVQVLPFGLRTPWRWLAPHLRVGASYALHGPLADRLTESTPDVLIGAGRRSALASIAIRRATQGAVRTIQILDPRVSTNHFDWVVAPAHDPCRGANVISTLGSLHAVDDAWLAARRAEWAPHCADLPKPLVAVLVGGPTRHLAVDAAYLERLVRCAERLAGQRGSLLVVTAPRTPPDLRGWLKQRCSGRVWTGAEDGANPYPAALAWADRLVVTGDSVNMLSEALATGRPVFTEAGRGDDRLARFHRRLREEEWVHDLDDACPAHSLREPPRETQRAAQRVLEDLAD